MSEEEIEALKKQAAQAEEMKDQMLRLMADFENSRKRMLKEQLECEQRVGERLLTDFLDVVDDFERIVKAIENHGPAGGDGGQMKTGMQMVHRRLLDFLRVNGVERMDAVGKPFDPLRHEAVAHAETEEFPADTVVEELRTGYLMDGRVIRPATVKVAVKPQDPQENKEDRKE
ncbi:MAG: nucleotide exchange factor GrpE [Candidatus Omnitrophica bacterium]|nr:nucleotide exchange factor GrpE [Candidatus Omnitrophota bacterium]